MTKYNYISRSIYYIMVRVHRLTVQIKVG